MANRGNFKKLRNGLTPKQDRFTKIVVKQIAETGEMNGTEAASQVYSMKDRSVAKSIAHENLSNPHIKQTIEDALNDVGVSMATIASNFSKIANRKPEKVSGDTILKANIELAKLIGAYPSKLNNKRERSIKQTVEELSYDDAKKIMTKTTTVATELIAESE